MDISHGFVIIWNTMISQDPLIGSGGLVINQGDTESQDKGHVHLTGTDASQIIPPEVFPFQIGQFVV